MTRRRCYYEVLSVEPTATDDELKRAYRKSALRLHPDKNIDRAEEAAEQFKEVQHAYSVLGDPDERAWYDSHKEAILTGRDDGGAGNAPDEVNLWDYFSPSAYGPVDGDEPNSFCSVYRELFDTVAREERQYADVKAPTFGDSTVPYATVQAFYAFWGSYSTRKSFAWKDEYKAASMPDRFQRRAAERINQKERDSARREYSKTLQDLVAFVKKRDPRVLAENKRLEEVAEQREAEQAERKAEAMEKVAARNKEWAKEAAAAEAKAAAEAAAAGDEHFAMKQDGTFFDAVYEAQARAEIERQQRELEEEMGQVEDPEQRLYKCAPCKKTLKGERLWTEHLKSNKHKAADKKWRQKNPELAAQADKEQAEEAAARKAAAEAAPAQPATPSPAPAAAAPTAAAASPTGASEPAGEGSDSESSEEEYVSAKKAKQQKKKAAAAAAAAPKHRDPAAEDSDEEGGRRRKDKGKKGKKKVAYDDEEEEPRAAKGSDLAAQLSDMQLSKKEAAAMAKMVADKAKGKKGNPGPQKASPVPADDSEDDTPSTMKKGKKGKGKK